MMDFVTLSQLNSMVSGAIKEMFPDTYWLMAEMSDVRVNHSSGHCYLEFIEKNEKNGNLLAKARAYIWNNTFRILQPYFEKVTGQTFTSGIKVLVKVGIEFHELYGYGLAVYDIDPIYTIGDIQRKRQEIIRQLEEEGVLTLNQELDLSLIPQRIAVITSPTAAGFEDFLNHLTTNKHGFIFYTKLFPAIMQGEQTSNSIINALDRIYMNKELFDAVVVIRGGGATSDLSSFDSYILAANCAQFPLPIITGIGHERDDTVVDLVAYKRAKTPTAVADFFIDHVTNVYFDLIQLQEDIVLNLNKSLQNKSLQLKNIVSQLPAQALGLISKQYALLDLYHIQLQNSVSNLFTHLNVLLNEKEYFLKLSSPDYILSRGYTITRKDGKIIKTFSSLNNGDEVETLFIDGKVSSVVKN